MTAFNTILNTLDWLLYIPVALSTCYIFCFAFASLLPNRKLPCQTSQQNHFLVIFPAYAEDKVILDSVRSFLKQTYPQHLFSVVVVADHMRPETIMQLQQLPITTLVATYQQSSKAKALQLTIQSIELAATKDKENKQNLDKNTHYDRIVILDADNKVNDNFLAELNLYATNEAVALQAHRQAKNTNTTVALLDAISEEINNTIFREAHNKIGMSSALIGSGMCFEYEWFKDHVFSLQTAGEDKEIEEMLLSEGFAITYLPDIPVYDEKVQSSNNFGNQRRRWLAAQFHSLASTFRCIVGVKKLKKAEIRKIKEPENQTKTILNLFDKLIQYMLVPRSISLCMIPTFFIITLITDLSASEDFTHSLKWLIATIMLFAAILISIPRRFYTRRTLKAMLSIPRLVGKMLLSLLHLRGVNKNFIHTKHGE